MKEELITFETAKLAKEKGFSIECRYYYDTKGILEYNVIKESRDIQDWNHTDHILNYNSSPTQSLLRKWLRDIHKCYVLIRPISKDKGMFYHPTVIGDFDSIILSSQYTSWEEALEIGLQKALQLIKDE